MEIRHRMTVVLTMIQTAVMFAHLGGDLPCFCRRFCGGGTEGLHSGCRADVPVGVSENLNLRFGL